MVEYAFLRDEDSVAERKKAYGELPKKIEEISLDVIETVIEKALQMNSISELYGEIRKKSRETENNKWEKVMYEKALKWLHDPKFYSADVIADVYMELLFEDGAGDFKSTESMCNTWNGSEDAYSIPAADVREVYPRIKDEWMSEGKIIKGGCEEFHQLMLSQENFCIFYFGITESLQKYAFPKTYKIYNKLKDTCAENLILFEKTIGMEYTNQIFKYTKNFSELQSLKSLYEIIKLGAKLTPMFMRKEITKEIWAYLWQTKFVEEDVKRVEDNLKVIIPLFQSVYETILGYCWDIYLQEYKSNQERAEDILSSLELTSRFYIQKYYPSDNAYDANKESVYLDFINSENIHDWRDINKLEDCFYMIEDLSLWERLSDKVKMIEIENHDGKRRIEVGACKNDMWVDIQNEAISALSKEWDLPVEDDMLIGKYYEECNKIMRKMKRDDIRRFKRDPRISTETHMKPRDVYARIHMEIIKQLNA